MSVLVRRNWHGILCRQGVVLIVYCEGMNTCKRAVSAIHESMRSEGIYLLTSVSSGVVGKIGGAVNVDHRIFSVYGTCRRTNGTVSYIVACENMQWQLEPLAQERECVERMRYRQVNVIRYKVLKRALTKVGKSFDLYVERQASAVFSTISRS